MKFQSVVVPDGLIANLTSPYKGKRHDSTMLHQSGLPIIRAACHPQWDPIMSLWGSCIPTWCPSTRAI